MARTPRKLVVDADNVGAYHCIQRCVRRAFLCGTDAETGKSFEHRREWIQRRLELLAGVFGVDVLAFAVMSNHLHVVLRNRPDVVSEWDDLEIARRWWLLSPQRWDEDGKPAEPTKHDLNALVAEEKRVAELRSRLSSLSWFMRYLAEGIARQANSEDDCTGRFWEGRYKCQPLLDEAAIVACMAYVDLNPIRAGLAKTPETSRFTSAFERIKAQVEATSATESLTEQAASAVTAKSAAASVQAARQEGGEEANSAEASAQQTNGQECPSSNDSLVTTAPMQRPRDHWLCPIQVAATDRAEAKVAQATVAYGRASARGCMSLRGPIIGGQPPICCN